MPWVTSEEWQELLAKMPEVCLDRNNAQVTVVRFTKEAYNPPYFMGLPSTHVVVMPALHTGQVDDRGRHEHGWSARFQLSFNLN